MADNAKQELVDFIINRALQPVLQATSEGRPDAEKRKLEDVQDATRAEIERFRNYGSAAEVVTNYKRDLHSDAAKRVHRALRELNLPTLNDIRDAFEKKAEELGVSGGS